MKPGLLKQPFFTKVIFLINHFQEKSRKKSIYGGYFFCHHNKLWVNILSVILKDWVFLWFQKIFFFFDR